MSGNPWLDYAGEDMQAAEVLYNEGVYRLSSFHAQQVVEKALKGLLWSKRMHPPKIHDVVILYQKARECHPYLVLDVDELEFLNSLYVESRYPADLGLLPKGMPTRADAEKALGIARKVFQRVQEVLSQE